MEYYRSKTELLQALKEQITFLSDECNEYDKGNIQYYKKIALSLRVLLYNTQNSISLLKQLSHEFVFTIPDFIDISTTEGSLPNVGSTSFVRTSLSKYLLNHYPDSENILIPKPIELVNGKKYPFRAFNTWFTKNIVLLVNEKLSLTRKEVVTIIANKDGGAHVDPKLNEILALLNRNSAVPLKVQIQNKIYYAKIDEILGATIRSIAEETLYIFRNKIIPICEKYVD